MKPPLRLTRETWLRRSAEGELKVGVSLAGFGTYGTPAAPWGFRQRRIDTGICYLLVGGGIRARLPEATFELSPGTLFLLAPGVLHDFELLTPAKPVTLYHLRLQARVGGRPCWLREGAVCLRHLSGLRRYFEDLLEEFDSGLPWSPERTQALLLLILSAAFRTSQSPDGRGLTLSQQVRLARFLQENRRTQPGPAQLAATLNLSLQYFSRLFKVTYRVIPRTWLVAERLRLASLELAETSKSITQVAEELGYRNPFLFSRQFSQRFGCSPRNFRQRQWTSG